MGDFDAAIKDFVTALKFSPDNTGLKKYCGTACLEKGDYDAALMHFSRARELDDGDAEAHLYMGR